MKKICLTLVVLALSFFTFNVFAATLTLDKIGALNTNGDVYSEWWYTGTDPILLGKAESSKTVGIKVDEESYSVTADAQGAWVYYLEAGSGDHAIVLTSEGETLSFLLHLGQAVPVSGSVSQTSQSATPVPETGVSQVLLITLSLLLITAGWYLYENRSAKRLFEKAVVKDRD